MKTPACFWCPESEVRNPCPAVASGLAIGPYRTRTDNMRAPQQTSLMIVNALTSSIEKVENTGMTRKELKPSFRGDAQHRTRNDGVNK
jgi:hypothetical protein